MKRYRDIDYMQWYLNDEINAHTYGCGERWSDDFVAGIEFALKEMARLGNKNGLLEVEDAEYDKKRKQAVDAAFVDSCLSDIAGFHR